MKQSIKQKKQLYAIFRQQSSSENKTIYKHYRNKLISLLRLLERNFYHSILEKYMNNLAKTWKIMKKIINKKKNHLKQNSFSIDNNIFSDPKIISEKFNNYFVNIGPKSGEKNWQF
jgi:hypothetical protein